MAHPAIGRFALVNAMALMGLGGVASPTLAQEATPEGANVLREAPDRPAHIHAGTCDELGEIVYPLTSISLPDGEPVGDFDDAVVAGISYTPLQVPLGDILGGQYAINVHFSEERIDEYIACGEIGGVLTDQGALPIALQEQNDSGFAGVAYLSPSATAPTAASDVSLFLVPLERPGAGSMGDAAADDEDAPDAEGVASPTLGGETTVDLSLDGTPIADTGDIADDEALAEEEPGVSEPGGAPGVGDAEATPDLTEEEAADAPDSADIDGGAGFATLDLADPSRQTVAAGEELSVVNTGLLPRRFVVDQLGIDELVEPGATVNVRFDEPGEYRFGVLENDEQVVQRTLVVE